MFCTMRKMPAKQRVLLLFISKHSPEPVKKEMIVDAYRHWYHFDAEKHIGVILYGMWENGLLDRPKHGCYAIAKPGNKRLEQKQQEENPDQTNLFE